MENDAKTVHDLPAPSVPLVDLVDLASVRIGLTQRQTAAYLRMDDSQYAKALHGSGHLWVDRLEGLPDKWWREFIGLLASRHGLTVRELDRRKQALSRVVSALNDFLQEEAKGE